VSFLTQAIAKRLRWKMFYLYTTWEDHLHWSITWFKVTSVTSYVRILHENMQYVPNACINIAYHEHNINMWKGTIKHMEPSWRRLNRWVNLRIRSPAPYPFRSHCYGKCLIMKNLIFDQIYLWYQLNLVYGVIQYESIAVVVSEAIPYHQ